MRVEQLEKNVFIHESYLKTNDFGKVKCNGAIFRSENDVVILDTPTNDEASEELIRWVTEILNCKITAVIPTHFHDDCLGGINSFVRRGIKSYAHSKTIQLAKEDSVFLESDSFDGQIKLPFGSDFTLISFFGKGHTYDNVVAYFPKQKTLFGGCLVKSVGAGKGYLGAADTLTWSSTIKSIQSEYEDIKLVIPGHGKAGGNEFLDYTSAMFEVAANNGKEN